MSFLIGGGGQPDYAAKAARAERRRQAQILQGTDLINAVFGGGTAPLYTPVTDTIKKGGLPAITDPLYYQNNLGQYGQYFAPKTKGTGQSMLDSFTDPKSFIPIVGPSLAGQPGTTGGAISLLSGLFGGGDTPSTRDLLNKQIKRGNLYTKEDKTYQGFGPDFYANREKAYMDFALPELGEQYRNQVNQTKFGLSNRGLFGSSAGNQAFSDVERANLGARRQIADTARAGAQDLRKEVESSRNSLISQLYQGVSPAQGLRSAIDTAAGFSAPNMFAPVGNFFSNLVNQYAIKNVLNPSGGGGFYGNAPSYFTGALPNTFTSQKI